MFFLVGLGMAVFTGQREQAEMKALRAELTAVDEA